MTNKEIVKQVQNNSFSEYDHIYVDHMDVYKYL